MKICAIIPSYNHAEVIGSVVQRLQQAQLTVFIIDDGSQSPAREILATLHSEADGIFVHRLHSNQGKGGAVIKGFELASAAGFTHAVQVDADGQHDLTVLPKMLALAANHPQALISGQPIYNETIPKGRRIGRWLTHVWVWVETLSFQITDTMCGFRVYPLAAVQALLATEHLGRRMDFDIEIMVRLHWRGVAVIMIPVTVIYPPHNISNFDMLRDNLRITRMHTRLVLTMLLRFPSILKHRPPKLNSPAHWATLNERGAYWGLKFCVLSYRLVGRTGCQILLIPIVLYFYVAGRKQRLASREFLTRALGRPPRVVDGYRHFMCFALRVLDGFIGWMGYIPAGTITHAPDSCLQEMISDRRGALIVVSHIGNTELSRALMDKSIRERMITLVHTRHAENYQRILCEIQPAAAMNIMQVTEVGPETIIALQQHIQSGALVSIAGDRTPVLGQKHVARVPFMGACANFAHGPWILAAMLDCPVYLLFCLPKDKGYCLTIEAFSERIELPREHRQEALYNYAARYAQRLEHYVTASPFQWFNFFPFWD